MTDDVFDYPPEELAEMTVEDRLLAQIRTGPWLDAQVFPPLQWAVDGLIPEGFGLVIGPPKLGKSWFILGQLLAISSGGRALGRIPVDRRPVLYLALEDGPRRMQSRVRSLNGDQPTAEGFQFTTQAEPDVVIDLIGAWLGRHPGGVIALDTLGKVMPAAYPGESAYQRDYRVGGSLKRLTDAYPGSSLLVVHHVRKQGSGDWMDSTSGTNGLNGSADWTLSLERGRNDDDAIIRVTGRDVTEGEYAATMRDGQWSLAGEDLGQSSQIAQMTTKQKGLGDQSAAIVEFITEHPDGVRAKQVAEALDMPDDTARRYLTRLEDAGRIERAGRGLYTPVPSVSSVPIEVKGQVRASAENGTLENNSVPLQKQHETDNEAAALTTVPLHSAPDQEEQSERDTWDTCDTSGDTGGTEPPRQWGVNPNAVELDLGIPAATPLSPKDIGHREMILAHLIEHGPADRRTLAEATGKDPGATSSTLTRAARRNFVEQDDEGNFKVTDAGAEYLAEVTGRIAS
ncbi:AAA family ATPase [Brevibacterium casei]|uniref:AAA family ATPase n=1 Tax=Brevibacterium casei TaxID=33889 RepID=UPI0028B2565D|nr:AAA family ATPase [Brevibacterium casei]